MQVVDVPAVGKEACSLVFVPGEAMRLLVGGKGVFAEYALHSHAGKAHDGGAENGTAEKEKDKGIPASFGVVEVGVCRRVLEGSPLKALLVRKDGARVVVGGISGALEVYTRRMVDQDESQLPAGEHGHVAGREQDGHAPLRVEFEKIAHVDGHPGPISTMCFLPSGMVASCNNEADAGSYGAFSSFSFGTGFIAHKSVIKMWRIDDPGGDAPLVLDATLEGHMGGINSIAVTPVGDVVSGSYDSTVKVWTAPTWACRQTVRLDSAVMCITVTRANTILVACVNKKVRVLDLNTFDLLRVVDTPGVPLSVLAIPEVQYVYVACWKVVDSQPTTAPSEFYMGRTWQDQGVVLQWNGNTRTVDGRHDAPADRVAMLSLCGGGGALACRVGSRVAVVPLGRWCSAAQLLAVMMANARRRQAADDVDGKDEEENGEENGEEDDEQQRKRPRLQQPQSGQDHGEQKEQGGWSVLSVLPLDVIVTHVLPKCRYDYTPPLSWCTPSALAQIHARHAWSDEAVATPQQPSEGEEATESNIEVGDCTF